MIAWECTDGSLQDSGPSGSISPMSIASFGNSLGNHIWRSRASNFHENQNGHAKCQREKPGLARQDAGVPGRALVEQRRFTRDRPWDEGEGVGGRPRGLLLASDRQ